VLILRSLDRAGWNEGAKTRRLIAKDWRRHAILRLIGNVAGCLTGAAKVERENFFASIGRLVTPKTVGRLAK